MLSNLEWIIIIAILVAGAAIENICDAYKETHKKDKEK